MAYDNDPYENMRDQPEFCDDCPLGEDCALKGMCGAYEVLYPLCETGLQEKFEQVKTKLKALEQLVEDWLPQIGMTITFRELFYEILGKPNPGWLGERQLTNNELKWVSEAMIVQKNKPI